MVKSGLVCIEIVKSHTIVLLINQVTKYLEMTLHCFSKEISTYKTLNQMVGSSVHNRYKIQGHPILFVFFDLAENDTQMYTVLAPLITAV